MVGLAARRKADGKGLQDVRLAFFGVGATPMRAPARRKPRWPAATSTRRSRRSRGDLDPPDDMQASGAVKKHLAGVLLRRVAAQLTEAAR